MNTVDIINFKADMEWYMDNVGDGLVLTESGVPKFVIITAEQYDELRGMK